jgi:hypothetical protein
MGLVTVRSSLQQLVGAEFRESANIPNNLEVRGLEEVAPCLPVVLGERILDADDGVLLSERFVHVGKLLVGDPLGLVAVGVLEVEVVFLLVLLVELARRNIHGNVHLALIPGLFDGSRDKVQSLLSGLDIGSDSTLVSDITRRLSILLLRKRLELLVDFCAPSESLAERRSLAGDALAKFSGAVG